MNANIGDLWMPTICLLGLFASLGTFHVMLSKSKSRCMAVCMRELVHGSMHVSFACVCNLPYLPHE